MSTTDNLNLKIRGDASGVKKASQEARQAVKQFENTSTGAVDAIAGALGVNLGQVRQYQQALQGAILKYTKLGKEGTATMSGIAKAASAAGAGIAGLGISAAVLAFKQLNAEADAFRQTMAGINMTKSMEEYRGTYMQAIFDANGASSGLSYGMEKLKTLGTQVAGRAFNGIMGIFGNKADMDEVNAKAEQAAELRSRLVTISKQERDLNKEIADYNLRISQQQAIIYDTSRSTAERQQAMDTANQLINEKYQKQVELQQQKVGLLQELNSLTTTSAAGEEEQVREETKLIQLQQQQQQEKNALIKRQNSLNGAVKDSTKELEKQRDIMKEMGTLTALSGISGSASVASPTGLSGSGNGKQDMGIYGLQAFQAQALEAKRAAMDLNAEVNSFLEGLQEGAIVDFAGAIGELGADLVNGQDAWGTFSRTILNTLADMAIKVGTMAIGIGVSVEGIRKALESLNPIAAIAAGTALVALGAAVKAGLSNVASGAGSASASSSVASSSYAGSSSSAGSSLAETMTINVTGTLQADGSKLVAVLNNEAKRQRYRG